jgi:hypothetical protein
MEITRDKILKHLKQFKMKFKTFNATNVVAAPKKEKTASISCWSKSGSFRFNKTAIDLLQLKIDEQLEFAQDEEKPENWYLMKTKENGFVVVDKKGYSIQNSKLAKLMLASMNGKLDGIKNIQIKIIDQPVKVDANEFWPLEIVAREPTAN